MKLNATILNLILIGFCCTGCATPTVKFTVNVTDLETGEALLNAEVHTTFDLKYDPWGGGDNKVLREKRVVDENGSVTFENADVTQNIGTTTFCDTYYPSDAGFEYTGINRILNRWEPWNPTIEVKMRKIKDPVPMVKYDGENPRIPVYDRKIGFDFDKADWVNPYGNGLKSDMFVHMYRRFVSAQNHDVVCTITFPNEGDGIQKYVVPEENKSSSYIFPYLAPTIGYDDKLVIEKHCANGVDIMTYRRNIDLYIFRIRTKLDKDGNIASACYGRINKHISPTWGDVITLNYNLNPDPTSRSLEYNDENLLQK